MVCASESPDDPVLGSGPIAAILRVAPRTVAKLIDHGQLQGFKLPGGTQRRVLRSVLVAFMRQAGLPEAWILEASAAQPACHGGRGRRRKVQA